MAGLVIAQCVTRSIRIEERAIDREGRLHTFGRSRNDELHAASVSRARADVFVTFNLMKNRVIIQAPPQPVLLLSGFEDPPGEFQAFGFDPIALFSGTLLELRVVESA